MLYFALLEQGIAYARSKGLATSVVTNAYPAVSDEDAELLVKRLLAAGLDSLTVSDDALHFGDRTVTPSARMRRAAAKLGLDSGTIATDAPSEDAENGSIMFRGRAADFFRGSAQQIPIDDRGAFDVDAGVAGERRLGEMDDACPALCGFGDLRADAVEVVRHVGFNRELAARDREG